MNANISRRGFLVGTLGTLTAGCVHKTMSSCALASETLSQQTHRVATSYSYTSFFGEYVREGCTDAYEASYDEKGRLTTLTYNGFAPEGELYNWRRATYAYDDEDYLYQIDTENACVQIDEIEKTLWTLTYDDAGVLLLQTSDDGQEYEFAYDLDGRLTSARANALNQYGTPSEAFIDYTYDEAGRLKQMGGWTFTYRADGVLETAIQSVQPETHAYRYDDRGCLVSFEYVLDLGGPSNSVYEQFYYDDDGLLVGGDRMSTGGAGTSLMYPSIDYIVVDNMQDGLGVHWFATCDASGVSLDYTVAFAEMSTPSSVTLAWDWLSVIDPLDPRVAWTPAEALIAPPLPKVVR